MPMSQSKNAKRLPRGKKYAGEFCADSRPVEMRVKNALMRFPNAFCH
ncbi:hypothetical protein M2321_003175 [Rhodoblastus acidophilus]|nr:hypothetical protein [Rhodoblastus acidophilus]